MLCGDLGTAVWGRLRVAAPHFHPSEGSTLVYPCLGFSRALLWAVRIEEGSVSQRVSCRSQPGAVTAWGKAACSFAPSSPDLLSQKDAPAEGVWLVPGEAVARGGTSGRR